MLQADSLVRRRALTSVDLFLSTAHQQIQLLIKEDNTIGDSKPQEDQS